jgi:hypothetical protein
VHDKTELLQLRLRVWSASARSLRIVGGNTWDSAWSGISMRLCVISVTGVCLPIRLPLASLDRSC